MEMKYIPFLVRSKYSELFATFLDLIMLVISETSEKA